MMERMKEQLKSSFKIFLSYFRDKEEPPQSEDDKAKNLDGMNKARVKPSGSGLKRSYVFGLLAIIIVVAMYSMLFGAGQSGNKLTHEEDNQKQVVQASNGSHLKNVPGNYTDEARMEKEKNAKPESKKETKPQVKEKAVQPRPTLPRQPAKQGKPRMTLEQQERMEEYEAMKKAYQSPIKFELKE
jgi:hypothetical protein